MESSACRIALFSREERKAERGEITESKAPHRGQKLLLNIEYSVITPFNEVVPASASPRNVQFRDDQGLVRLESRADIQPSHPPVTPLAGSTKPSRIRDKQFRRISCPPW